MKGDTGAEGKSKCGSRCFGLTWFYLWIGCGARSRASALERTPPLMKFTATFPST